MLGPRACSKPVSEDRDEVDSPTSTSGKADAGANGLDQAQRGKPVAKHPHQEAMTGRVDAGANALQRALRAKGVAKRPHQEAKTGRVDAGANWLDRAQRGKTVAKRPRLLANRGKVDAGANGLDRAQRGKPVAKRPRQQREEAKWTLGDLNPRPSGCKPDALPTELSALVPTDGRGDIIPAEGQATLRTPQAHAHEALTTRCHASP